MLGRASYSVGSDVYLGANEASHLIGAWNVQRVQRGHEGREGREGRGNRFGGEQRREGPGFGGGGFGGPFGGQPGGENRHERHEEHVMHREEWERAHPGEDWQERERRRMEWERTHHGVPFVGVEALMGAADANPHLFPPRAALVSARPPSMANREPLPMSTGTAPVGIGLTAQITSRPQRVGFRPERLFVSNYSLDGLGATAWTINDITIGNVSQLAQAGNLPGDMFANVAIDSFVTFKTAQTAMDVVLITTYNGTTEGGIPFTGAVIGLSAQS